MNLIISSSRQLYSLTLFVKNTVWLLDVKKKKMLVLILMLLIRVLIGLLLFHLSIIQYNRLHTYMMSIFGYNILGIHYYFVLYKIRCSIKCNNRKRCRNILNVHPCPPTSPLRDKTLSVIKFPKYTIYIYIHKFILKYTFNVCVLFGAK